ncbi:MAG: hypothetical protein LBT01_02350 [Spirochaetaceae bacterium]|jgi:hypothetical protein|nr:hypothetical protein [Spirochaetaceae bacterium]
MHGWTIENQPISRMMAKCFQCIHHLKNGSWKSLQGEHNEVEICALMVALDVKRRQALFSLFRYFFEINRRGRGERSDEEWTVDKGIGRRASG